MSTTVDREDAGPEELERGTPAAPAGSRADTAVAVGVPTVLVGFHLLVYGRWIVDDAGITMAYARSIATGAGPVIQPGAAVSEGWSDPAWLALLVVGRWLGLFDHGAWFGVPDLVAFPKLLGLLCAAGIFWAFHQVTMRVSRSPVTLTVLAGTLTAAAPPFVVWIGSGLENPLIALAVVLLAARLVTAALDGRLLDTRVAVACGLLAGLAALTRPDGAVYLLAHPLAVLVAAGTETPRSHRFRGAATSFASARLRYCCTSSGACSPSVPCSRPRPSPRGRACCRHSTSAGPCSSCPSRAGWRA